MRDKTRGRGCDHDRSEIDDQREIDDEREIDDKRGGCRCRRG